MEDQKNENFFKNGKNNLNNFKNVFMSTNYVMTPCLSFYSIMECCCDKPLLKGQLKCSLNSIFKTLTMR